MLGKVIAAIINEKGGVGKTTTAKGLTEWYLRNTELRVLGIDIDPQANYSSAFVDMEFNPQEGTMLPPVIGDYDPVNNPEDADWDGRTSTAMLFRQGEAPILDTRWDRLSFLPSHPKDLKEIVSFVRRERHEDVVLPIIRDWLREPEMMESYDVVIIDCPPSGGPITASAVRAATHLIIPSTLERWSINGLFGMSALFRHESQRRSEDDPIEIAAILPTMVDARRNVHRERIEEWRKNPSIREWVTENVMHNRAAYAASNEDGATPTSVFDLAPSDQARKEAEALFSELDRRLRHGG